MNIFALMDGLEFNLKLETDNQLYALNHAFGLTQPEVRQAISRAINYATARARTRMKSMVVGQYNLKSRTVDDSLVRQPATRSGLTGYVYGSAQPESLGHFNPVEYRDNIGTNVRGGGGGGYTKTSKRGAGYSSKRNLRANTKKSGIYFAVVKGNTERLKGAWLWFKGATPIVMARGKYVSNGGKTKAFKFAKPRMPINKINTKSVYWGVLNPTTVVKWEPETETDYLNELVRQCGVILQMRP